MFAFTTETQSSRRESFFFCRGGTRQKKEFLPRLDYLGRRPVSSWRIGISRFSMITLLSFSSVPRMSPIAWDEWVVKIVWNLLLLVINTNVAFDVGSQVAPIFPVDGLHLLDGRSYIFISGIFDLAHLLLVDHGLAGQFPEDHRDRILKGL